MLPVFVIVRDRFQQLCQTVASLEKAEGIDIILVDNQTTYEPTVEYLKTSPHQVIYLNGNYGHLSPWHAGIVPASQPYAVTDPDVKIVDDCPSDWPAYMQELQAMYPQAIKVGFSLRIDNLPDHYMFKQDVIAWETQFWQRTINAPRNGIAYDAAIDTTLAIYRPGVTPNIAPAVRTAWPYTAEHLAWYVNSSHLTEDEVYYKTHATSAASWRYSNAL